MWDVPPATVDKLHTRWHVARIALLDAGQFQRADNLLRPGKPSADEPEAVEYRRIVTERIESVEKDIKDGKLTPTPSAHGRVERQKAAKEFYSACRAVKKCDRCGASERKLRRDGASKLFQLPLAETRQANGCRVSRPELLVRATGSWALF